ncbi:MAG: PKD domain-containing protein [Bacteroidales bacterium]|jgi:gliding motility-associated-like protein
MLHILFRKSILPILLFLIINNNLKSQSLISSCENSDFSEGNFLNWSGSYAIEGTASMTYGNPIQVIGIDTIGAVNGYPPHHEIIRTQGMDPYTCNSLKMIPDGYSYSCRLGYTGNSMGNSDNGAQRLEYSILVDTNVNGIFIYKYAFVLQEPLSGHAPTQMPKFDIVITDNNGNIIDPVCGQYSVYAGQSGVNFNKCADIYNPGNDIDYVDWTTIGMDLKQYHGQTVKIQFTTYDCALGGHFAYAYLTCLCLSRIIVFPNYCSVNQDTVIMCAPDAFYYKWSTGETTQCISIINHVQGTIYSCTLKSTADTTCKFVLKGKMEPVFVNADFFDTIPLCAEQPSRFYDISTIVGNGIIYSYSWNFGDGASGLNNFSAFKNPTHSYSTAGTYSVTLIAKTNSGCSDTVTKIITINSPSIITANNTTICKGKIAAINAGGANTYTWSNNLGVGCSKTASPTINTTYFVTGTDINGCTSTAISVINVHSSPEANANAIDDVCEKRKGIACISPFNGEPPYTYRWNTSDNDTCIDNLQAGSYTVTITGSNGCFVVKNITINNISYVPDGNSSVDKVFEVTTHNFQFDWNGTNGFYYHWDFGDGYTSNLKSFRHVYKNPGIYTITLKVISQEGCENIYTLNIEVVTPTKMEVFNVFTPNSDNINDKYKVKYEGEFLNFKMMIFSRWGNKLFETDKIKDGWDGKGMSEGTYYYIISAKGKDRKEYDFHGAITLIR